MPVDRNSPAFRSILAFVHSVPRHPHLKNTRDWRKDPSGVALMVQQLLSMGDVYGASDAIGEELGNSAQTLRLFARGLDTSYMPWPELRAELTRLGVAWLRTKHDTVPATTIDATTTSTASTPAPIAAATRPPTGAEVKRHEARMRAAREAISRVPVIGRRRQWNTHVGDVLIVAEAIVKAPNEAAAVKSLADDSGIRGNVLLSFAMGKTTSHAVWPALRREMARIGLTPRASRLDNGPKARAAAKMKTTAATSKDKPIAATLAPPPAVSTEGHTLGPMRPLADYPPPAAFTYPRSGGWHIDPITQDIFVMTTSRLAKGTPEHSAKLLEIALSLGTRSGTTANVG